MKKLLLLVLFVNTIHAQEKIEFFDPYELKKGMKGYALTVMQGLEPEKMELEVIAFMPNKLTKSGMILVKLSGKNVERSRVAAGMSGSPVYIDGKLVGALAYTWANALELLAGIVPIQDMISDKTRSGNTVFVPQNASPIQTAWFMNGMEESDILQKIQNIPDTKIYGRSLEEFITIPSSRSNGIVPLKAGDAVAIKLMEGDINLASIGTVTYVDGEDFYIYGHPMDSEGPINLPVARAEIYDVMSSSRLSFKLGSALPETIGSTVFDGHSSVYGRFDKKASMIPVTINVRGKEYSNTYNMNMAKSRKYLPTLISEGMGAVLERELGKNIEKQVQLSWKLEFTNNQIVSNSSTWVRHTPYAPESIQDYWENYISILWSNSLVHLVPSKMEFNIDVKDEYYEYYAVSGVKVAKTAYYPGEDININLILQQYLAEDIYTNMTLTLPKNLVEGAYTLLVGSSISLEAELTELFPDKYAIRTVKQLLKELKKPIDTNVLQAVLVDVREGSLVGAGFFEHVPQARQSLFESKTGLGETILVPKLYQNELTLDAPVIGSKFIFVNIVVPEPVKNAG